MVNLNTFTDMNYRDIKEQAFFKIKQRVLQKAKTPAPLSDRKKPKKQLLDASISFSKRNPVHGVEEAEEVMMVENKKPKRREPVRSKPGTLTKP